MQEDSKIVSKNGQKNGLKRASNVQLFPILSTPNERSSRATDAGNGPEGGEITRARRRQTNPRQKWGRDLRSDESASRRVQTWCLTSKIYPSGLVGAGIRSLSQLAASASCDGVRLLDSFGAQSFPSAGAEEERFRGPRPRTDRKESERRTRERERGESRNEWSKYEENTTGGVKRRKETTKESTWS